MWVLARGLFMHVFLAVALYTWLITTILHLQWTHMLLVRRPFHSLSIQTSMAAFGLLPALLCCWSETRKNMEKQKSSATPSYQHSHVWLVPAETEHRECASMRRDIEAKTRNEMAWKWKHQLALAVHGTMLPGFLRKHSKSQNLSCSKDFQSLCPRCLCLQAGEEVF